MNTYSMKHPHEPQIPPALDAEGRCLVCGLLVERDRLREAGSHLVDFVIWYTDHPNAEHDALVNAQNALVAWEEVVPT